MPEQQTDLLRTDLSGKVVLVTGSGSGIGAAIAVAFGEHGAKVGIHYDRLFPGLSRGFVLLVARLFRFRLISVQAKPLQTQSNRCRAASAGWIFYSTMPAVWLQGAVWKNWMMILLLKFSISMPARLLRPAAQLYPFSPVRGVAVSSTSVRFLPNRWQPRLLDLQCLQGLCQHSDPLLSLGIG